MISSEAYEQAPICRQERTCYLGHEEREGDADNEGQLRRFAQRCFCHDGIVEVLLMLFVTEEDVVCESLKHSLERLDHCGVAERSSRDFDHQGGRK